MSDDTSRDAAIRALSDWNISVKSVEPLTMTENIVFKVTDQSGLAYVLRLHRPGYHTLKELISEQRWTAALLDDGLDVPVPRTTCGGQAYTSINVGDEHRYVGLLEWVDGVPMQSLIENNPDAGFITESFSLLGGIMAECHNQAVSWTLPEAFARHSFDADGLMGEGPFWGRFWESALLTTAQQAYFDKLRRHIHAVLDSLGKDTPTYSLIHADLHPDNIVIDGQRLHVIDFDDSGFGWHQYDIAVALFNYQIDQPYELLLDALVRGYRKVRPISDAVLAHVPLFLLIRALVSIGWISARPEVEMSKEFLPRHVEYALSKAAGAMAYYDISVDTPPDD